MSEPKSKAFSYLKNKSLISLIVITLVITVAYLIFYSSPAFDTFESFVQQNKALYIGFLFIAKLISIVYPPIPGGAFTLGSIPVLSWEITYIIDFLGSVLGGIINYQIGLKYGSHIIKLLFDKELVHSIKNIKIKKDKEVEMLVLLRMAGGTVVEALSYIASLLKISLGKFVLAAVISHIILGLPMFVLADGIFNSKNLALSIVLAAFLLAIMWRYRNRYLDI